MKRPPILRICDIISPMNEMYPVAIMQGRLSPDPENFFQFFPADWAAEFAVARDIGFTGIEWLIDSRNWKTNPVFTEAFVPAATGELGVPVSSVGADWFMEVPLWEGDPEDHRRYLRQVINAAAYSTQKLVMLPLLEKHTIHDQALQQRVLNVLRPLVKDLELAGVRIAFETELAAESLARFIDSFESEYVGVYFDSGNCTSYGFDCPRDILQLGHRTMGVHIKDRKVGTTKNVPLGTGDADFIGILSSLRSVGWKGSLVMQAWRGQDYKQDAAAQLKYINQMQQQAV